MYRNNTVVGHVHHMSASERTIYPRHQGLLEFKKLSCVDYREAQDDVRAHPGFKNFL